MVSAAVDALRESMWANAVKFLRHGWSSKAFLVWVSFGFARWIAAYAAALVRLALRAARSRVAEALAEGALDGGCG